MCCLEGGDAAAAGGAEKTEEKKEDESKYTVIGSNAPKQKKGLSMYSKCGAACGNLALFDQFVCRVMFSSTCAQNGGKVHERGQDVA